jgi:fumarylacetoacetase
VNRPCGHYIPRGSETVVYQPSNAVDYELEFAALIGRPLPWGSKLDAVSAEDHIFGYVLLNDWSGKTGTISMQCNTSSR